MIICKLCFNNFFNKKIIYAILLPLFLQPKVVLFTLCTNSTWLLLSPLRMHSLSKILSDLHLANSTGQFTPHLTWPLFKIRYSWPTSSSLKHFLPWVHRLLPFSVLWHHVRSFSLAYFVGPHLLSALSVDTSGFSSRTPLHVLLTRQSHSLRWQTWPNLELLPDFSSELLIHTFNCLHRVSF